MPRSIIGASLTAAVLLAMGTAAVGCRSEAEDDGPQQAPAERTRDASTPTQEGRGDADADDGERDARADADQIDEALAERGEDAFQAKGCTACHTVGGGRLVGPDLAGVTDRRERGWILAMIQDPDSMLRNDPDARSLLAQYGSPMTDLGVTADEAAAIYEYLREETEEEDAEESAVRMQEAGTRGTDTMKRHHRAMHNRTPEGAPSGTEPNEPIGR